MVSVKRPVLAIAIPLGTFIVQWLLWDFITPYPKR
jgi:hypothetical protein